MRKRIPASTETEVFTKSRRRCCLCYGLHRDKTIKMGQITHLDHNNHNNRGENLTWMCLQHHNEYDTINSQCKNYTLPEVRTYIRELDVYVQRELLHQKKEVVAKPAALLNAGIERFAIAKEIGVLKKAEQGDMADIEKQGEIH